MDDNAWSDNATRILSRDTKATGMPANLGLCEEVKHLRAGGRPYGIARTLAYCRAARRLTFSMLSAYAAGALQHRVPPVDLKFHVA
jgi:hypothetical protein